MRATVVAEASDVPRALGRDFEDLAMLAQASVVVFGPGGTTEVAPAEVAPEVGPGGARLNGC